MHEIVLHITMSNNHIGGGGMDRVNGGGDGQGKWVGQGGKGGRHREIEDGMGERRDTYNLFKITCLMIL